MTQSSASRPRRPWSAPALVVFGGVEALTLGTTVTCSGNQKAIGTSDGFFIGEQGIACAS
jgi:hypothetical protein